jgi:mRNA interferase MazF
MIGRPEVPLQRGELWSAAGGPPYANKPRPVLIVQDDIYGSTTCVTVCGLTSDATLTPFTRPLLQPDALNCLRDPSRVMVDKISSVPRSRLDRRMGRISNDDMRFVERALMLFLGMAR